MKWWVFVGASNFNLSPSLQNGYFRFLHLVASLTYDLLILLIEPVHKNVMVLSYIHELAIPIWAIVFFFYFPTTLFFHYNVTKKWLETSSITFYFNPIFLSLYAGLNWIFLLFTTPNAISINPPIIAGRSRPNLLPASNDLCEHVRTYFNVNSSCHLIHQNKADG